MSGRIQAAMQQNTMKFLKNLEPYMVNEFAADLSWHHAFYFAFFPLFGLSLHVNFKTWLVKTAQCGKILFKFALLLLNTTYYTYNTI